MSTEPEPNQSASPAQGGSETPKNQDAAAKEAAAKALGQAKEKVTAGLDAFKKLDLEAQVYLGGLAVTVLTSLIFSFWSVKIDGPGSEILNKASQSVSIISAGANGFLAVLAAVAGIGLWVWNFSAKKKEAWVPLALAGSAGLSALLLIILWLRVPSVPNFSGMGVKVSAGPTLLGFWLPLAAAIAATAVSVKKILKPAPAPSA
jgi:hypothetical protein